MSKEPLSERIARLERLAAKLSTGKGPNYPVRARMQGEIESLAADPPDRISPLAEAIIGSLSRILNRLMHDHPKFTDLVETHIAALNLASKNATLGTTESERLMAELEAATAKVMGKERNAGR
jgi:hypothetical protein